MPRLIESIRYELMRLHPLVVAAIWLASAFAIGFGPHGIAPATGREFTIRVVVALVSVAISLAWLYAIHSKAQVFVERTMTPKRRRATAVFAGAAIFYPLSLWAQPNLTPLLPDQVRFSIVFVAMLMVIAVHWMTAASLVKSESDGRHVPPQDIVVTFLLFLYAFVGVWLLYPRLLRLADRAR